MFVLFGLFGIGILYSIVFIDGGSLAPIDYFGIAVLCVVIVRYFLILNKDKNQTGGK